MTPEEARAQYPACSRVAYLNAGSMGPLSRAAAGAVAAERRRDLEEGRAGRAAFERARDARERVRALLAAEVGAAAEQVAVTRATTDGCNIVLAGLGLGPGDEVVTTGSEHFGLLGPLHASGARVVVVPVAGRPARAAVEDVAAAVGPRTRLVAVSEVLWTTGHVVDPAALKRAIGDVPLLVDGAQSVGAIPVDAAHADFTTVSCQKWLCCPDSSGALVVRDPERLPVRLPSYFSQDAHEPDGSFTPKPGARRFDNGWLAPGLLAGIEAALAVHPPFRFERAAALAALCRQALLEAGHDVVTEPGQATLVAWRARGDAAEAAARAAGAGVSIRDIPGTGLLRASLGYWNDEGDVERLVAALA